MDNRKIQQANENIIKMNDTHKTLLIALLSYLEDITNRVDIISRLLLKAMEFNNPEVEASWYLSQEIVDDLLKECRGIRTAMDKI